MSRHSLIPIAVAIVTAVGSRTAPGEGPRPFAIVEADAAPATANRAFRLLVPDGVEASPEGLPLVIYLHGAGSKGDDTRKPLDEPIVKWLASEETQRDFPCFVLVPQCRAGEDAIGRPNNWVKWENQKGTPPARWERGEREASDQLRGAMAALDEVLARHAVDESRIYLSGVSMGGSGAWSWAAREPFRFAAVVTACGLSEVSKASALAEVPVWAFHGSDDPVAPSDRTRRMVEAIRDAGGIVRYTEFAGEGHGIAGRLPSEGGLLEWLFAQRKGASR